MPPLPAAFSVEVIEGGGPVLRGEKVLIRPFTALDIGDSYVSWLNDAEVVRFSNQRFIRHDRESCLRYLASFKGTANLFMSIRRLSDDCQIGTMTAYMAKHHGTVDVGIMIGDKTAWGSGFGQDAWNVLSEWLLKQDGIRKLTAGTLACNHGMLKLMQRSGMQLEAVRKAQEMVDGQPTDIVYYAKFHDV